MPLVANGLGKLIEECGELQQIAGKKLNYPNTDQHPDGQGSMSERMEKEIADVLAACDAVIVLHNLNLEAILQRQHEKYDLFMKWHKEE